MGDESDKPQLPVASTSILAGEPEPEPESEPVQLGEVASDSTLHLEQEDQPAPTETDDNQTAAPINTPPESPTGNVPDISISRPSISSITDTNEGRQGDRDAEAMSNQPGETTGREVRAATNGPDSIPHHTEAANADSSPPSPPPKRESRPESEMSMPTNEYDLDNSPLSIVAIVFEQGQRSLCALCIGAD